MTKTYSFFAVAVLFLALAFSSCQNQVDGCTDPNASNYDPNATHDDGSCTYAVNGCTDPTATNYNPNATVNDGSCQYSTNNEAGIVFWFSQLTANSYIGNDNITSFKFVVDGVDEGTHFLNIVDSSAPACDAVNHVTVKRTVPQGTVQFIPYVMEDQNGTARITGQFQFLGGSCYAVEITY
jgi:hypothetical protein